MWALLRLRPISNGMNKIMVIVLGVVIVGGGSFYGGMKYDQAQTAATRQARLQQFNNGTGGTGNGSGFPGGQRNNRAAGNFAAGEVLTKDDKSITIKMRDGGSKIIFLTGSTPITKSVSGSVQDISVGSQVTVMGTANQDGSLNAESVQIRPNMPQGN